MRQLNICVVGAGVNGLSSALCIKNQYPGANITIIADKFSPLTTGDGAAGLWLPYLLSNTPEESVAKWSKATYFFFHQLWKAGLAEKAGICLIPLIVVTEEEPKPIPGYFDYCFSFHEYNQKELQKLSEEHGKNYRQGFTLTTFTCEPVILLPYLLERLVEKNCKIIQREVLKISDLYGPQPELEDNEYDVIVNCCGMSAKTLVDDRNMFPIRGQVARVSAPWQFHIITSDGNYIIPNIGSVVLGGTHQKHNYNLQIDKNDSEGISNGCKKFVPGLKTSPVLREWVGLRPARDSVRLEIEVVPATRRERLDEKSSSEKVDKSKYSIVIHNYGHGGAGITLCWGCAVDVTELLQNAIKHLLSSGSPSACTATNKLLPDNCNNLESHL